ncbi:MAG: tRNA (adenine-N1)-methyltransferase [Anaerolineales bacterium]
MAWNPHSLRPAPGELAQLIDDSGRVFFLHLTPGASYSTHRGQLIHDELLAAEWGSRVQTHKGYAFTLLPPRLHDILHHVQRRTQTMYAKDIGFVLMNLNIGAGQQVIEAGCGSGAFTIALAYAVGAEGHVYSYEKRPEALAQARQNLQKVGLSARVTFYARDIAEGFEQTNADALFLDLPNPEDYLPQSRAALKPGGFFGTLLPTTNQVGLILAALLRHNFAFTEVCEILLRYYQAHPARFRPADRMTGHTGYLIFSRPVNHLPPEEFSTGAEEASAPDDDPQP